MTGTITQFKVMTGTNTRKVEYEIMSHAERLRELLAGPEPVIAPGVYDGLTALLVERAGFDCAYLSGASVSFARLGRPDLGLTTMTEVAQTVGNIRERIEHSARRRRRCGIRQRTERAENRAVVRAHGRIGRFNSRTRRMPKRCGHLDGKTARARRGNAAGRSRPRSMRASTTARRYRRAHRCDRRDGTGGSAGSRCRVYRGRRRRAVRRVAARRRHA